MKLKKIFSNIYFRSSLLLITGLFIGWLLFSHSTKELSKDNNLQTDKNTIWTCSMHPQIRMEKPGLCPICAMDLIPLEQNISHIDDNAIVMNDEALKLADIQTIIVSKQQPVKEIRLYGKIQADERLTQTLPSHVPGRIEKLSVNFTGEQIQKGQVIASIYSPDLITAQQELFEAMKMKDIQPRILDAAREKLSQYKLTKKQIEDIETSGKIKYLFDVIASSSGVVIKKNVNYGDYVNTGTPLYEVSDLNQVWALFDAYESDLPWIKIGSKVSFTLLAIPGKELSGNIVFIDPVIDPLTRIAKIRIEVNNLSGSLKPEMLASGIVIAKLAESSNSIVVPQSAVLWTGKRSLVYVKIPDTTEPTFLMREVTLGTYLQNSYVILAGLIEGEEIVTNGIFSIDAAAQLSGKASMMNETNSTKKTKDTVSQLKIPVYTDKTDIKFKQQLSAMYKEYLKMKDAFVASDAKKVIDAAKLVKSKLNEIDVKLLKGEAHKIWIEYSEKMNKNIQEIILEKDIDNQRKSFALFNNIFYQSIKSFGMANVETFYQFCPMALNDEGAYWFSSNKEISNPYFGKSMLRCGETKETFQ